LEWENAGRIDLLRPNYPLRAPEILFRKIEDKEMEAQREKLMQNLPAEPAVAAGDTVDAGTKATPYKPEIVFDDFAKIDLRAGTILAAEKVEKADKLLKLEV